MYVLYIWAYADYDYFYACAECTHYKRSTLGTIYMCMHAMSVCVCYHIQILLAVALAIATYCIYIRYLIAAFTCCTSDANSSPLPLSGSRKTKSPPGRSIRYASFNKSIFFLLKPSEVESRSLPKAPIENTQSAQRAGSSWDLVRTLPFSREPSLQTCIDI